MIPRNTEIIRITTMTSTRDAAQHIANQLTSLRYAACAQVEGPVTSTYWWKNTHEKEDEWRCTLTTRTDLYPHVAAEIQKLHSYEEPEIIAIPVYATPQSFIEWVKNETNILDF